MKIKRYDYNTITRSFYEDEYQVHGMYENENGEYFKANDVERLVQENEKLKQERDSLYVILKGKNNDIDMLTSVLSDVYQSGVNLGENEIQVRNALVSHDYQSSELNK